MIRTFLFASVAVTSVALAQAPAVVVKAPIVKADHQLACPAGTRQVGGLNTRVSAIGCMKAGANGAQVFHGPKISLYDSGKVEAVGQTEEGFQTGKWTFYNEAGVKVGETEFLKGDYNGRRVEYFTSGQVKLDEQWVAGKRQGAQKTFTEAGVATVTEYRDDRPVAK